METIDLSSSVINFLILTLPIVIPIFLAILLFDIWIGYVRERFLSSQEYALLKIIPPTDVLKTPLAMELFINGLHQTFGEATLKDRFWVGSVRPTFSLEITSNDGKVNFYIWTRKSIIGFIESQIYAQYPGIEIVEADDYATKFEFDRSKHKMWALEYNFTEDNSIPIRTYVDYGLDKPSKEEEKVDPITPMLEFLGSTNEGERIWFQILIKAHKKEDKKPGKFFGKTDLWEDNHKEQIKKIQELNQDEDSEGNKKTLPPSEIQKERIQAIERSQGKLPFDVGIRSIYISEKDNFNPVNIGGLIGAFKQYSSKNMNGFKPANTTKIDHWWQDPFGKNIKMMEDQYFNHYRERAYFYKEFMGKGRKVLVMNAEELATIFHFPGTVAMTPNLERVKSRKSNSPSDLPV
jgi:hypothetical protein